MIDLLSIVGALGGTMGLIELIKYLMTRKQQTRITETAADRAEFELLRDVNTFLQQQLNEKEQRFTEQTEVVRRLNRDIQERDGTILGMQREICDLKLQLAMKRCDDLKCPHRQPPNAYTPPK